MKSMNRMLATALLFSLAAGFAATATAKPQIDARCYATCTQAGNSPQYCAMFCV